MFAKTLRLKNIVESGKPTTATSKDDMFSSKAQVMTLMTTDIARISSFPMYTGTLVEGPVEVVFGACFLYSLLGSSALIGLAVTCLFLPIDRFSGKLSINTQKSLMKTRDERMAIMNEVLGSMRMLKFMAWERKFESKISEIRERELKYQRMSYLIEILWMTVWNIVPILITLVSFFHFTVYRQQTLTAAIAFPSILVLVQLQYNLGAIPDTLLKLIQVLVSLRRIERFLDSPEVQPVPALEYQPSNISFISAMISWPQREAASADTTPDHRFSLLNVSLNFPPGKLSLICGRTGSGKTLLLSGLLGEADVLAGRISCPRSPPDALAALPHPSSDVNWIVNGLCAYVPQVAWLQNASIKENILFGLSMDEKRYTRVLEICALVNDLKILEDGDESEIGERGINLSGGQKARVSLARAVYSRASTILLDDVLSAVDAHTAQHLYEQCLTGDLMQGRTIILVSHHVHLCAPGAAYIVTLDNGRVEFQGSCDEFFHSAAVEVLEKVDDQDKAVDSSTGSVTANDTPADEKMEKKPPKKLVEDEYRAEGRVGNTVWRAYFRASGGFLHWVALMTVIFAVALNPVWENLWIRTWTTSTQHETGSKSSMYYITVYAIIKLAGVLFQAASSFILYFGSIRASRVLHKQLLNAILFAKIRFHDTVARGRVLNRFGKDFEGLDSSLAASILRSSTLVFSSVIIFTTISIIGGPLFVISAVGLGYFAFKMSQAYSRTAREVRRLQSVTLSPVYSLYGETLSGTTVLRAFGSSSLTFRNMIQCIDTTNAAGYWSFRLSLWLSGQFNLVSAILLGVVSVITVSVPWIDAALAGFALTFTTNIANQYGLQLTRELLHTEYNMVALERILEFTTVEPEGKEFTEPRPESSWPSQGAIKCQDLVVKYAPDLPPILHKLNFNILPGEKIGILGRTGSGKTTLALSLFRFVDAFEGKIIIDGMDISQIGLTDLRTKLTIIPQDPTIFTGTIRSTVDMLEEYDDNAIFEALRRVHLIPSSDVLVDTAATDEQANINVFRNLDSTVSEGGENFSAGQKQLLCLARAILKRSKVLVLDEATASIDYATDELISKTIREEFAASTIITIAHRIRTVIDYDRVMVMEEGRIVEMDRPRTLLEDPSSQFYSLCKATGAEEFSTLQKMAN